MLFNWKRVFECFVCRSTASNQQRPSGSSPGDLIQVERNHLVIYIFYLSSVFIWADWIHILKKISPGFFSGGPPHKPAAEIQTLPLKKTNTNFSTLHLEYLFVSKSMQMSNSDIFPNCWQYIQHLKVKVIDFQNFPLPFKWHHQSRHLYEALFLLL